MITGSEYTFLSSLQGSANQIHSEIPLTPTRMDMIKKKKKKSQKQSIGKDVGKMGCWEWTMVLPLWKEYGGFSESQTVSI